MNAPLRHEPFAAAFATPDRRIDWVDCARGWCIVLVVAMHTILGVGNALHETGWPHEIVLFAKPFRMPDFFLIAGLFASRAVERETRAFIDRKVVHYVYFYALWTLIVAGVKQGLFGDPLTFAGALLVAIAQPYGDLWFIYLLPVFYLAARWTRGAPTALVLGLAAIAHVVAATSPSGGQHTMESDLTGWVAIDSFLLYAVFFFAGHRCRDLVFAFATLAAARRVTTLVGLGIWALLNAAAVAGDVAEIPGLTLVFGLAGAFAVVAISSLLARAGLSAPLAFLGRRSLFIYVSFTLPMAATRMALLKLGVDDVAIMSGMVLVAAIAGPLVLERATRGTPLRFLYHRPEWAHYERRVRPR